MSLSAFLLSLALLLTLRMADAPPRPRAWIGFGLLWGVLALPIPRCFRCCRFVCFICYGVCRVRSRQLVGFGLCILAAGLVVSPWLVRNYAVFGKFVFVRDNLRARNTHGQQ